MSRVFSMVWKLQQLDAEWIIILLSLSKTRSLRPLIMEGGGGGVGSLPSEASLSRDAFNYEWRSVSEAAPRKPLTMEGGGGGIGSLPSEASPSQAFNYGGRRRCRKPPLGSLPLP